jgi:hypothetical protein
MRQDLTPDYKSESMEPVFEAETQALRRLVAEQREEIKRLKSKLRGKSNAASMDGKRARFYDLHAKKQKQA